MLRVTKSRLYVSWVREHVVHLGLNVNCSAHKCGCVVDSGGVTYVWQQFGYYYYYLFFIIIYLLLYIYVHTYRISLFLSLFILSYPKVVLYACDCSCLQER